MSENLTWRDERVNFLKDTLNDVGVSISIDDVNKIHFLAQRKYNRYDQYLPGETFQNRMIKWLCNFKEEDRQNAMEIIDNLVYLNNHELRSIAVSTFWNSVKIIEIELFNQEGDKNILNVYLNNRRTKITQALKRSLYVAVADDVMFDYFRRRAQRRFRGVLLKDNFVEYYKLHNKCQKEDLDYLKEYDRIFLLDQLCGSGTTFLRKREGKWKGKINKMFEIWEKLDNKKIYYTPYIMSKVAQIKVGKNLEEWKKDKKITQEIIVIPTFIIPMSSCLSSNEQGPIDYTMKIAQLCKRYFNETIVNEHILEGGDCICGFGGAGLALVLNNNCPNNTIPLIWQETNDWHPLFPRIDHHVTRTKGNV